MKPHSIGRTLGIGLRVAGRIAGQRMSDYSAAPAPGNAPLAADPPAAARAVGQAAGRAVSRVATQATAGQTASQAVRGSAGIARGMGGFLRPFRRVGGILWLEVTGVFFLLFVVAFAPTIWRTRASWAQGPDHRTFLVSAVIVALFLYLSVSSFWRARRK